MPRLRLIAGPNGSGKTTLTDKLREEFDVPLGQYTNPDEIELSLADLIADKQGRSIWAQKISKDQREGWLQKGISHSYESVMSHPSHIDYINEANHKGFKSYLYYVCLPDPLINTQRVKERVEMGGHPVPESKILSRYNKSLDHLYEMASICHRVYFFDNAVDLIPFAEKTPKGYLDIYQQAYYKVQPDWFRLSVLKKWDPEKVRLA